MYRTDLNSLMLSASQSDHPEAWHKLVSRATPRLRAWASQLVTAEGVDDVVQDTWLLIWSKRHLFRPGGSFMGWAKWAVRVSAAEWRDRRKQEAARIRRIKQNHTTAETADPADQVAWRDALLLAKEALVEIPVQCKNLLILFHIVGMPVELAAEACGIKPASVPVLLSNAMKILKDKLAHVKTH